MINTSRLFELEGKVALVTGSGQGLGREIAISFAQHGCSLILADIMHPGETAEEVRKMGGRCVSLETDISDERRVGEMLKQGVSEFKRVDILVNNAGVSQLTYTPTQDLPVEEWDKIIRINLRGTFLCCQYVGRQMIEQGGGNIINIASTAGINGVPRAPAYCASKAGVILLTKSLALEWVKYKIRVNAIAPHYIETALTRDLRAAEKVYDGLVRLIPMRRFAQPVELIGTVLLLSSSASSYITGTVIAVDGGFLVQ